MVLHDQKRKKALFTANNRLDVGLEGDCMLSYSAFIKEVKLTAEDTLGSNSDATITSLLNRLCLMPAKQNQVETAF